MIFTDFHDFCHRSGGMIFATGRLAAASAHIYDGDMLQESFVGCPHLKVQALGKIQEKVKSEAGACLL